MPVLIIAGLLRTIWAAYDFDVPYLLAQGGPLSASTTLPIQVRSLAFERQDIGLASALAVLVALILLFASFFYLRAYRSSEQRLN
jgi:ABC-type sugar transport system permease subunit